MSLSSEWDEQKKALKKRKIDTKKLFDLELGEALDDYEGAINTGSKSLDKKAKKAKACIESYLERLRQPGRFQAGPQQSAANYVAEFLDELHERVTERRG